MTKRYRGFWMEEEDYKKLKEKANKLYQGKGYLERYMEDIARNGVIIVKGEINVRFSDTDKKTIVFI